MVDNRLAVSVVLPVYNGARYIERSVGSILRQTHANFELVVVDDGSTDMTSHILKSKFGSDKRLKIITQENLGIVSALNAGVTSAVGEFVARMDADDVSVGNRLHLQLEHMMRNTRCVAVGGQALQIDKDGDAIAPIVVELENIDIVKEIYGGRGSALIHSLAMFRRAALLDIGIYKPGSEGAEDVDLYLRLAEIGLLENLPSLLQMVRRHRESVTSLGEIKDQNERKKKIIDTARARNGLAAPPVTFKPMSYAKNIDELEISWASQAYQSGYYSTGNKYLRSILKRNPRSPMKALACTFSMAKYFFRGFFLNSRYRRTKTYVL